MLLLPLVDIGYSTGWPAAASLEKCSFQWEIEQMPLRTHMMVTVHGGTALRKSWLAD